MTTNYERHWRDDAACIGVDPELFYATTPNAMREARRICNQECPVKAECLDRAYEVNDQYAVMGGMSPRQRTKTRAAWRRKKEQAA